MALFARHRSRLAARRREKQAARLFFFFSRVTRGLLEVQEERLINYYHYYDHA